MKKATPNKKINIRSDKKILKQLEELFWSDYFNKEKQRIRKVCEIPKGGYTYKDSIFNEIINTDIKKYLPKPVDLKDEDRMYILKDVVDIMAKKTNIKSIRNINIKDLYMKSSQLFSVPNMSKREYIHKRILPREISKITEKIQIKNIFWVDLIIKSKILFKDIDIYKILNNINTKAGNLCIIEEADNEYAKYAMVHSFIDDFDNDHEKIINEKELENLFDFPISIRIHPTASQRDIIGFIKSNWETIENIQKTYIKEGDANYKNSKGVINPRAKIIKETIYKNQNKSLSKIETILKSKNIKEPKTNLSKYRKDVKKGL